MSRVYPPHVELAAQIAARRWPVLPLHRVEPSRRKAPLHPGDGSPNHVNWWLRTPKDVYAAWDRAKPVNAQLDVQFAIMTGIPNESGEWLGVLDIDGDPEALGALLLDAGAEAQAWAEATMTVSRGDPDRWHLYGVGTGDAPRTGRVAGYTDPAKKLGVEWRAEPGYVVLPGSLHESGTAYEAAKKRSDKPLPIPASLLAEVRKRLGAKSATAADRPAPDRVPNAPYLAVIERLRERGLFSGDASRGQVAAKCPAHDDRNASLSVAAQTREDGTPTVLVNCHREPSCSYPDIMRALDLTEADGFEQPDVEVEFVNSETGEVLDDEEDEAEPELPLDDAAGETAEAAPPPRPEPEKAAPTRRERLRKQIDEQTDVAYAQMLGREQAAALLAEERAPEIDNANALVDLRGLLSDTDANAEDTRPKPTAFARGDDACMLYEGTVNALFGPTESGKSMVACAAMTDWIVNGRGPAVYLDLDANTLGTILDRVRRMLRGTVPEKDGPALEYRDVQSRAEMEAAFTEAPEGALVVIDTSQQVYGRLGLSQNKGDDWLTILTEYLGPMVEASRHCTVLVIDHVAKLSAKLGPSGAHEKVDTLAGSVIRVTARRKFVPGRGGSAVLSITKDRHGGLREKSAQIKGTPFGEAAWAFFELGPSGGYSLNTPLDDGWTWDMEKGEMRPPGDAADAGLSRDAVKVLGVLQNAARPMSRKEIEADRHCRRIKNVLDVLSELLAGGFVLKTGAGPSTRYVVAEDDEPGDSDDEDEG